MGRKKWQSKLLSGILCASLVFQSLSVTTYASEEEYASQILAEQTEETVSSDDATVSADNVYEVEDADAADAVEDTGVKEISNVERVTEELKNDGSDIGSFANIQISFSGFTGYVTDGTYTNTGSGTDVTRLCVVQYDKNDHRLCANILNTLSGAETYSFKNSWKNFTVHKDASYVRLEAFEGDAKTASVVSEKILCGKRPDVTFHVDKMETGTGSLIAYISYEGDFCINKNQGCLMFIKLSYGTSTDESTWKTSTGSVSYSTNSGNVDDAVFTGLSAGQIYYGKLTFYQNLYDDVEHKFYSVFEQTIALDSFTTKEGSIYNLKTAFPDPVLRQAVIKNLNNSNLTEDSDVSSEELEKITNLNFSTRNDPSTDAVEDITGLDLLTGLTTVSISNHEIDDITGIDWSKLNRLSSLYLYGNNIADLPDLSRNTNLTYIELRENLLTEQALESAFNKIPPRANFVYDDQRVNGFELQVEDNYYVYSAGSSIYVKAQGYKSAFPYTLKFYLDGVECEFTRKNSYYCLEDIDLSCGEHKIKAELYYDDEKEAETTEYTFLVVEEENFLDNGKAYINSSLGNSNFNVRIYLNNKKSVSKAQMIDDENNVYAENYRAVSVYSGWDEPRFKVLSNISLSKLYYAYIYFQSPYNVIPAGSYHLKLEYTDGTTDILEDTIVVKEDDESFITGGTGGSYYNCYGDYIYLVIYCKNIDPSKLEYTIKNGAIKYPVTYVSYKDIYNGVAVKLRKEGWKSMYRSGSSIVTITGKDGYTFTPGAVSFIVSSFNDIFYACYNDVTEKMEVGFSDSINGDGKEATISLRKGYDSEQYPEIVSGSAVISDGIACFELKNPDGTKFEPEATEYYYFSCVVGGKSYNYNSNVYIYVTDSRTNYWSTMPAILEGTEESTFTFYSDFDYIGENINETSYSAEITGENLDSPVSAYKINTYERSDGFVNINMKFETGALLQGAYKVTLYKGATALSSYNFNVMPADKFILNSVYTNWISKSEIQLYLSTPNTRESDNYRVVLTDLDGNEVPGLTTTISKKYDTALYLSVKGLNYADADKKYYVKVVSTSLGEPYNLEGTPYYTDDRGNILQINKSSVGTTLKNGRVCGLYLPGIELPAIVSIYKPYDTDLIYQVVINSEADLNSVGYYYFDKTLYNSLPDKDSVYNVTVLANDNNFSSITKVLGCLDMDEEETVWDYKVDRTTLFLNNDDEKTATISVSNNTGNPTFTSSDTSVVTVKADKDNPAKAVMTAVGLGVAEISITADGITKKFNVSVEKKVSAEELILNKTELSLGVGTIRELTATILPVEAWNDSLVINYTSSDSDVVAVEKTETGETVKLTALKSGTATITAELVGTELVTTCEVTVNSVYSSEEQDNLLQEAGTAYVLLNAYDKNSVTLKDVTLPAGWTWEDDTVKLVADDAAPVQRYMAYYEKEGYESFGVLLPVAVSKLTGVSVTGDNTILTGEEKEYEILCKYTGYKPVADEYGSHLSYEWAVSDANSVVTLEDASGVMTKIRAEEGITKNTSQAVNVVVKVDGDAKKSFNTTLKLTVTPKPYVDAISIKSASDQLETKVDHVFDETGLKIDYSDISTEKDAVKNTVRLEATAYIDDVVTELPNGIKWTSSDSNVVTVKAEKDSRYAVVTFKKAGSAVIQATSSDGGKMSQELVVSVMDYTPIMETNKLTVSLFSTEGTVIPVKPQNNNRITDISILENGAESDRFTVVKNGENFTLKTSGEYTTDKSLEVKAVLRVVTENGIYEDGKAQAVTIAIDAKKKPSASVKLKTKANLFNKNATAVYTVTSKYEIAGIEDVTDGDAPRFYAVYDAESGTISFDTDGTLSKDTLEIFKDKKKAACKVKLKVNFTGYSDAASQIIEVTVATEEKKPSLKMDDVILVPGVTTSTVSVRDTKTKDVYPLSETDVISIISDTSKTNDVTAVKSDNMVAVSYDGSKDVNYKAEISSEDWTQTLTVNGKISVEKEQVMLLDTTKVVLNTAYNIQENGKLAMGVYIKNNDSRIKAVEYKIDKKNADLFNNGYLSITYSSDNQQVYVGLNKGKRGNIKAGTYKVKLYGTVLAGSNEVKTKPVELTISLIDKKPTVSLSGKGSIDLVRRDSTSIVYTPKFSNVTATVEGVKLAGSYAAYFDANVVDGRIEIRATDQAMSTKVTYPVKIIMSLDNGSEMSATVKIKPVNKQPKLTSEVTKVKLYKSSPETISFSVVTNSKDTKIAQIKPVEDKNSKYFDFAYNETTDKVSVSFTEEACKMKPGKYTVSYQVYVEGAAYNVKPTTMKLTVTVK